MGLNTLDKPESIYFRVSSNDTSIVGVDSNDQPLYARTITLEQMNDTAINNQNVRFVQTEALTEAGVAVQPYGAFIANLKSPTVGLANLYPVIAFDDGTWYYGNKHLGQMTVGTTVTFSALS